jgi:hypothetical protein
MNEDDTPEIVIDDAPDSEDVVIDDQQEDEEPEISFGDEPEGEEEAPDLPKRLRTEIKERDRRLLAAERELDELRRKTAPTPIEVGPRPRLEDFDYDEDKHNAALDDYEDRKVQAALQKQNEVKDDGLVEEAQTDVAKFQQSVQALTYPDAKDIVASVGEAMPAALQYAVAATALDPATFIYAMGKHPAKLQELLAIKNPTKQIAAIVRMEASMKVGQGRKAPEPDRPQRGNAGSIVKADKKLEQLEKDAARTGDRTELIRYRKSLQKA